MKLHIFNCLFFIFLLAAASSASCVELRGIAAVEYRQFLARGEVGQKTFQPSVFVEPELYQSFLKDSASITVVPFLRLDALDDERSHWDIREFMVRYHFKEVDLEVDLGIGKVFWGVTESQHLVDIINQTDSIESLDNEDKLGQPMLHVSWIKEWGSVEGFLLPYFRERTFPGEDGRLSLGVENSSAQYKSSKGNRHLDFAVRYSTSMNSVDLGVSYFQGTGRDPDFIYNQQQLLPFYRQIRQVGIDAQWLKGDFSWVSEALWRDTGEKEYFAITAGFEYSLVGITDTNMDLGILTEVLYDSRGQSATTAWQQDIFIGTRLAVNDIAGTEILLGVTQDLDYFNSRAIKLEASSRITNSWLWRVNGWIFNSYGNEDPLSSFQKDDYLEVGLEYYY
ncbi:hypothetical protein MJO52_04655 [Microbulbifer variabilis]|uniref:DUF3187 family protein n=1 Tax=Microbulbifer variabilis TaxID=266805 RepID=A0ABY4VHW9_9GAMM|nr:hypothetical protein [Microbulbifer variabilis]USD22425.1 hypothetical protein MJO52_04655 [Microbulbifer variabilis]